MTFSEEITATAVLFFLIMLVGNCIAQSDSVLLNKRELGINVEMPLGVLASNLYLSPPAYDKLFARVYYRHGSSFFKYRYSLSIMTGYVESYIYDYMNGTFYKDSVQNSGQIYYTTDTNEIFVTRSGSSLNSSVRIAVEWVRPLEKMNWYQSFEVIGGVTSLKRQNQVLSKNLNGASNTITGPLNIIADYHFQSSIYTLGLGYVMGVSIPITSKIEFNCHAGVQYLFFFGNRASESNEFELWVHHLTNDDNGIKINTDASIAIRL